MLVAGETRNMTGLRRSNSSPAAEVTFTSGGCCGQCLLKTSIEAHKKRSTLNTASKSNPNDTRIANPHGISNQYEKTNVLLMHQLDLGRYSRFTLPSCAESSDGGAINSTPFQLLPGSFRSVPLARAAHEALVQQRRMLYRQTQIPKSQKQVRSISQDLVSFWSIKGNTPQSHPARQRPTHELPCTSGLASKKPALPQSTQDLVFSQRVPLPVQ